jgi:hypothetical protein
MLEVENALE